MNAAVSALGNAIFDARVIKNDFAGCSAVFVNSLKLRLVSSEIHTDFRAKAGLEDRIFRHKF